MTCIYCGGDAYTPYAYGCEHWDGSVPEPEFVERIKYSAEWEWTAFGDVSATSGCVTATHPTREGAVAAWQEAWLWGRAVQVIANHVVGLAREGAEQVARAEEAQRLVEDPRPDPLTGRDEEPKGRVRLDTYSKTDGGEWTADPEPRFKVGDRVKMRGRQSSGWLPVVHVFKGVVTVATLAGWITLAADALVHE